MQQSQGYQLQTLKPLVLVSLPSVTLPPTSRSPFMASCHTVDSPPLSRSSTHRRSLDGHEHPAHLRAAGIPIIEASSKVAVSARAIVSLEGLSEVQKTDVLQSLLLAQLVANEAHAPDVHIEAWCAAFNASLEEVGWTVHEYRSIPVQSVRRTGTVEVIVLDEIARSGGDVSQYQQDLLWSSIRAVQASRGSAASLLTRHATSTSGRAACFQLAVGSIVDEKVKLRVFTVSYETTQQIEDVLGYQWPDLNVGLTFCVHQMTLNSGAHDHIRATVTEKLGDRIADIIPLGPTSMRLHMYLTHQ